MQFPENMTPYVDDWDDLYALMRDLFKAAAVTCVLLAAHRAADALLLGARVKALDEFEDAFAPEEREVLIHKIKHTAMR